MFGSKKEKVNFTKTQKVRIKRAQKEQNKKQAMLRLRNYFLTGLLVIVPLGITFFVLKFIIGLADGLIHVVPKNVQEMYPIFKVPGLGMVIALTLIMMVGFLARNFVGRKLVNLGERIISRIPLVRSIYSASKQLLETIFAGTDDQFEHVVILEYPRKGVYSLGFVTGRVPTLTSKKIEGPLLSVFIPTTPNPTSGWYILVPACEVIPTKLSVEEGFKIIISAGMAMPKENIVAQDGIYECSTDTSEKRDE